MNERIAYLDTVKSVAIIMVVIGHVMQFMFHSETSDFYKHDAIWLFIYSFHMPLFMIVSGMFANSSLKHDAKTFFSKKSCQLLMSASIVNLLFNGKRCAESIISDSSVTNVFAVFNGFCSTYWFLYSLFCCYIIFWISVKLLQSDIFASIISCCIVFLLPIGSFVYISFMLPFFWTGYYINKYIINKNKKIERIGVIATFAFLVMFPFWDADKLVYDSEITVLQDWNFNIISWSELKNMIFRFIIGLSGSLMVISICKMICINFQSWFIRITNFIGTQTKNIYIIQQILLTRLSLYIGITYSITNITDVFLLFVISLLAIFISLCIDKLLKICHIWL